MDGGGLSSHYDIDRKRALEEDARHAPSPSKRPHIDAVDALPASSSANSVNGRYGPAMSATSQPAAAAAAAASSSSSSSATFTARRLLGQPDPGERDDGAVADEEDREPAYKGLDAFRKEAIFRRMLEARRELQRAEARARRFETSVHDVEARLAELNRFWSILVEDVRVSTGNDAAWGDDKSAFLQAISLVPMPSSSAGFSASLDERTQAIRALLSRIARLSPASRGPDVDQLQARCHELAAEVSDLRAKLSSACSSRDRLSLELGALSEALRRAEKRLDRLLSPTVQVVERPGLEAEQEAERARAEAAEAERQAAAAREAAAAATAAEGDRNGASRASDAATAEALGELQDVVGRRGEENERLRAEVVALRQEAERLRIELHRIPDERILESALYRDLHQHFTHAKEEHERVVAAMERIDAENAELRERREEFQQAALAEANASVDDLRNAVKAHEADVVRLRGQRDDLHAEMMERRQREGLKLTQVDEMKSLVNAKEARIRTLRSEVHRLQLVLAAKSGDRTMVERVKKQMAASGSTDANGEARSGADAEGDEVVEIIADLQARLRTAEDSAADLRRQLDARTSSTSEADLAAKVSSLQAELDKLTAAIGAATSDGSNTADVSAKLISQHERIAQLEMELHAANESTNALCEEVDKLSSAYSMVEKQASAKTFDVVKAEDKMARLMTEKSKADNKFFSAMRAKDALENERRVTARNLERQLKVIERYAEAEKAFAGQLVSHEREVTTLRKLSAQQASRIAEVERDLRSTRTREQEGAQQRAAIEERMNLHIGAAAEESARRVQAEERIAKLEKELDKAKRAAASAGATGGSGVAAKRKNSLMENDNEADFLNALLRCSSCKDRYRDRILLKCLHTFCHDCLEARIQTRQRKCPHCAASFATSDVQQLYLQ